MPSGNEDNFWNTGNRKELFNTIIENLKEKDVIRVVFMCILNCSRSPYGEMMLDKYLKENSNCYEKFIISSKGVIPGEYLHEFTKKALLENNVSEERISRFQPSKMNRKNDEELTLADLILVPTKRFIEILIPKKFKEKTFLISELKGEELIEIDDFAQETDYRVYKQKILNIDQYLLGFIRKLKEAGIC